MGACFSKPAPAASPDSPERLAAETHFTVDEVYALQSLYKQVSNSLHKDELIHLDEFALALFNTDVNSLFAQKVFKVFDFKQNDVIDFGEFVRALSIFHPTAPLQDKATFAFKVYDLDGTGAIEPGEVSRFLAALLRDSPALQLSEAEVAAVVAQTFEEADQARDGRISPAEWQALVASQPGIVDWVTLPVLKELTLKYPSFVFNTERA